MDVLYRRLTGCVLYLWILVLCGGALGEQYRWHVGGWSECQHERCGAGGSQYRDVWCIQSDGRPVASDRCEEDFKPIVRKSCIKPCSENVVLKGVGESNRERPLPGQEHGGPKSEEWEPTEPRDNRFDLSNDFEREESQNVPRLPLSVATSDVEWVVSQWSSCRLESDNKACGRNSGIRTRNVTCERRDSPVVVSNSRCLLVEPMPQIRETCELLCRQDCVVSDYFNWTECSSTCMLANKTRTRVVIVPPRHRGSHCPELSDMVPCVNCTASFIYQYMAWLPCTSMDNNYANGMSTHPLIGYQTREVACLQSKGVLASDRYCQERFPHTIPRKARACVMAQDCILSSWSPMTPHNSSCIGYDGVVQHGFMVRTRQVLQLPLGSGDPCPSELVDYIRLNKEDLKSLRSCKQTKWITSNWTPCESVPGYNHCGTGIQTRNAICVEPGDDGVERPVEEDHCMFQYKPSVAASCTIECNYDCSVSQWSAWSTCQDIECEISSIRQRRAEEIIELGIFNQDDENVMCFSDQRLTSWVSCGQQNDLPPLLSPGKRFRTRVILTLPGSGGKPCPHVSETRMCEPQPCFTWNITLGPCEATVRGGCGEGTQLRKAVCLNRLGAKVRERFCHENLQAEQNWANCYVPCPEDCIVSEWGSWSSCPNPCDIQLGGRVVRTRTRQILSSQLQGRSCPYQSNLRQTEPCPVLQDCETYQWEVSSWGTCVLEQERSKCGRGTQTRNVDCFTARKVRAPSYKCLEKIQPVMTQTCVVPCPSDCELTEWSDWSACGVTCLPLQARQIYPTQIRKRYILQQPLNSGVACPSDLVEEQSCLELPVCQSYYWEMSDWSDCILAPEFPRCGHGLRARHVKCKHANNQVINDAAISVCLENLGFLPDLTEKCHVPCESECQFENWSPWTQCDPRCERSRFRYRPIVGDSKRLKECQDSAMEQEVCVCSDHVAISMGAWSDCIIDPPTLRPSYIDDIYGRSNSSDLTALGSLNSCGTGKQYMTQYCQNPNLSGYTRCSEPQEKTCTIPCPVDCETTQWTSWSACSVYCGSGIQHRERRIMALPSNGGRKCPFMFGNDKESQTRVCTIDCSYKVWKADDWGPCFPNGTKNCGEGTHARQLRCVSVSTDGTETTVDNHYCGNDEEPVTIKPCSLPCAGDCVMSEWSDWTPCRQPCNGQQTQKRYRSVLRWPRDYDMMRYCTAQQDERTCERQVNCIEYSWELSDWTSCLVNEGRADCGVGHKERFAMCRNEAGAKVESYKCQKLFGPVTEPLSVSCEIPCDYDCLLSAWSEWTPCSVTCGLGVTLRKRTVLQNPMGNGRKCPEKNEQSKSCYSRGCYRWHVTEWSECNIEMNFCGMGVQERNVSCLSDYNRRVNTSKCSKDLEKLVTQTVRPCHVPCPGECFLSEWSSWSHCFISCEDFEQRFRQGVQARSRAILAHPMPSNPPCNTTMWEDRPCEASQCTLFKWSAGEWDVQTGRRSVVCERTYDGLQVEGGCDERLRPSEALLCDNPKCVSPAYCSDYNECDCPGSGQYTLYNLNSTARSCRMNITGTGDASTGTKAEMAKSPNIWMYAVIVVGTVFVIAVTAALYNMCELFRTGPRPRPKGENSREGSTTGTIHSVRSLQGNSRGMTRSENLYKQINHVDSEEAAILSDRELPSPPSQNSHHGLAPLTSPDPEDIPDVVSPGPIICTSAPVAGAASNNVTSTSLLGQSAFTRIKVSAPMHDRTNPVKFNRRYHRLHRLLPQCFACDDGSNSNTVCVMNGVADGSDATEQTVALTYANLKDNMDSYDNSNYSANSSFQSHNCMLSRTHPRSLEMAKRSKVYTEFSRATDAGDEVLLQDVSPPRGHVCIPHAGTREDLRLVTHTSCCSSSESLAMSSDLISGKQEESSQCSLQLGDTAETIVSQDAAEAQPACCQVKKPALETIRPYHQMVHQPRSSNLTSKSKLLALSSKRNATFNDLHTHSSLQEPSVVHYRKSPAGIRNERTPSGGSSVDELCYYVLERPVHQIPSLDDLMCSQRTARSPRPYYRGADHVLSTSVSALMPSESQQMRHKQNIISGSTNLPRLSRPHKDAVHPISTSPSFASLPDSAVHSAQRSRKNLPLLEKASQDSGHASIPRSRTVSPGEFSLENNDVLIRTGSSTYIKGYSPLHVQTSVESGNECPTPSPCSKKDLGSPSVGLYLLCSPDTLSQHSNISGMETSV